MKYSGTIELFDDYLKHIAFDRSLYQELQRFRLSWAQKSDIYIEFLGGNLTGVHPVRFSTVDEDKLFAGVFGVDQANLKYDLFKVPGIDKTRRVTSNPLYQMLFYTMHRFATEYTNVDYKPNDIRETYYIMAYKIISSLLTHYFVYNANIPLAKAVYERLSNRFLIKRFGTWQKVFDHRAMDVLPKGLHYDRVVAGSTDDSVRVIADLQGRIRENIKNIYAVLKEVEKANEKIYSTSMLESGEEGMESKDIESRPDMYMNYARSIINEPNSFINDDLVYLVRSIITNLPEDKFVDTLKYISMHYNAKQSEKMDLIDISINTTINYLRTKNITNNYKGQMHTVLTHMRGYWSSSSVKSADVKAIKNNLFKIAGEATGMRTKWLLATICIGVLLYVFLRSVYKNK